MSIERMENVPNPLIIKWIRKFSKILRQHLNEIEIPEDAKKIEIIELDELFTYCQKKLTKSTYGLLLIEEEVEFYINISFNFSLTSITNTIRILS